MQRDRLPGILPGFLLFTALFPGSLVAQSSLTEELARAKSKWEMQGIENYSFVISNTCSCPLLHAGPLQIVVEDGKIRRTVYLGEPRDGFSKGQSIRRRTPLRLSIPGLFAMIEKQFKLGNAPYLKIKYEDKLGHPVQFEYDDPALKDEQVKIQVKDFKRL